MGNNCHKSGAEMTSDERETWHWETYIRYIPGVNAVYGVIRAGVYCYKSFSEDDNSQHVKECWKSLAGVVAGVLTILIPGALAGIAAASITSHLASTIVGLLVEMLVGGALQTGILAIGDIATSWKEWKAKSWTEREKWLNDEVLIKIPFLGFVYSLARCVYKWIRGDGEEAKESFWNTCFNAVGSMCGLWAAYGMHKLACGPKAVNFFKWLGEKWSWADDLGRFIFKLSDEVINGIQHMALLTARGTGKVAGNTGLTWLLNQIKEFFTSCKSIDSGMYTVSGLG